MTNASGYGHDDTQQAEFVLTGEADLPPPPAVPPVSSMKQALLTRLVLMAQRYRQEGQMRQATEMFWALIKDYPDTPESETAKAELLKLAEGHERAGNLHMARGMYEQLMELED